MGRRALDSASIFPLLFGEAAPLRLDDGADVPEFKWIHVATTGKYRGHWQGEFDLTREVFQSFVKNLHAHPQYALGDVDLGGGKKIRAGCKPTIQFDYEHCSEMPATEGAIPKLGAEAPAWVLDLELRDADGETQLWALAWLGAQIRDQIKRNAYRQTSIAFDMESRDWKTGEPAGPALTSIAFTNHPFLRGLESYAAANRRRTNAPGATPPATPPATPAPPQRKAAMDAEQKLCALETRLSTFKANICGALGIRVLLEDGAVVDAAGEVAAKGGTLAKLLNALGVADADTGMKVIPEFRSARDQLANALQELDQMLSGQAVIDEQMAAADIAAVMSVMKYPDDDAHREMLAAYRKTCLDTAVQELTVAYQRRLSDDKARVPVPKIIEAKQEGRQTFLKKYGITEGVDTSHLTKTLVASKGGTQHPAPNGKPPKLPLSDRNAGSNGVRESVDLKALGAANPVEAAIKHLTAAEPTFGKLSHYQKCKRAAEFCEQNDVVFQ
jgi:Mu-like prophage I protein